MRFSALILILATAFSAILSSRGAVAAGPDFSREVRPILAGHCFKCHGPDDKVREAGLRLDDPKSSTFKLESGDIAIVPGKPTDSELVRRINSTDADTQMPPRSANKPLTDQEKRILRDWIAAGAEYKTYWAFVPPRQTPLPDVKQAEWPKNPIDYFILARLEAENQHPSPPANRYALVRRLYVDLLGYPPTPDEADEFVNDTAPNAYEKLLDQLLASPHYGERWARRWLDLARYADTNGFEKDRPRSIWPYRDWVIRALNADMPFDQFGIEQLAGDMLHNATPDQRIATGFHRNTMLNEEGGNDPQEFRYYSLIDRVNVTGTVWLGLTVGCAIVIPTSLIRFRRPIISGLWRFSTTPTSLLWTSRNPTSLRNANRSNLRSLPSKLTYPIDFRWIAACSGNRSQGESWHPRRAPPPNDCPTAHSDLAARTPKRTHIRSSSRATPTRWRPFGSKPCPIQPYRAKAPAALHTATSCSAKSA